MSTDFNITHPIDGDESEYDSVTETDGTFTVNAAGAITGSYGVSVQVNSAASGTVRGDATITNTTTKNFSYRLEFDPNGLTMTDGDEFLLLVSRNGSAQSVDGLEIIKNGANYEVLAIVWRDDGVRAPLTAQVFSDAPHTFEILRQYATDSTSNDGYLELWIDNISVDSRSDIDIDGRGKPVEVQVGLTAGRDSGTSGTFYFDSLKGDDAGGYIGLTITGHEPMTSDSVTITESVTVFLPTLTIVCTEAVTIGESVLTSAGSGTGFATMLITGVQADINATLLTVMYTSNSGYTGADTLTMTSTNATNNTDTDTVGIAVVPAASASDYDVVTLAEAPIHRRRVT